MQKTLYDPLQDGISKVEYMDHMGTDLTVVNAARVSLHKFHTEFSTEPPEDDASLIRFLANHEPPHWTPFGHPQIQFRIKMPIFVAREWFRHTIGVVRNEMSRRYVDSAPEFFIPEGWRMRAKGIKQGSKAEFHPNSQDYTLSTYNRFDDISEDYEDMLANDVAPEIARIIHPVATYTEFVETGSLYFYARVASLRVAPDAQRECRAFAEGVVSFLSELYPVSWAALWEAIDRPRKMRAFLIDLAKKSPEYHDEIEKMLAITIKAS